MGLKNGAKRKNEAIIINHKEEMGVDNGCWQIQTTCKNHANLLGFITSMLLCNISWFVTTFFIV